MKVNKKTGKIKYDREVKERIPPIQSYEDLEDTPNFIAKTEPLNLDSGAAQTKVCLHSELEAEIVRAFVLYEEGSSADAGITLEVGKESDRDYYYTGASEVSKAQWYAKKLTLLKKDIAAGDTVTFYCAGNKTGVGEVSLHIEYKLKGIYTGS